ncbi:MAG: hypothetical protein A2527_08195 [Candidatus Lambdaproteobacteria bacterium RIFOXYD2_FULL_50_16]|uniref:Solute-binding protein family 3/N-terminal domain-containing protein n=1 Tax=Candidatus Lambdaproteobacteria bacterium RIFOXYD2_FULL_50_16 TaxID=1817772 RepID=A0A1F6GAK4_9PROT|nr:MAG: hypothetical protein A2527_08195 [Candidatus Lambdaproteobacteria bacterium RIFOXYD2_FULL_50_16]
MSVTKVNLLILFALIATFSSCATTQQKDDYLDIFLSGRLKIGIWIEPSKHRSGIADPITLDRQIASELALDLGLTPQVKTFERVEDMANAVKRGNVDVAAIRGVPPGFAELTQSITYLTIDQVVIAHKGGKPKSLCFRQHSPEALLLEDLPSKGYEKKEVSSFINSQDLLERVQNGECDATVVSNFLWDRVSQGFPKLEIKETLVQNQGIAFFMRPQSQGLRQQTNQFLFSQALANNGGLLGSVQNGAGRNLRMLTTNQLLSFFIAQGNHFGMDYEILKDFAQKQKYHLEVVLPSYQSELAPWLNEKKGDLIGSVFPITAELETQVAFTKPYLITDELVVVKAGNKAIKGLEDLKGKTIHVRLSSSAYQHLEALQEKYGPFEISPVPEDVETEQLLDQLEQGLIEVSVADQISLDAERFFGRKLQSIGVLFKNQPLAFAVRKDNPELLAELNDYIDQNRKSGFFNIMKIKYTANKGLINMARGMDRADASGKISPYDEILHQEALKANLDWRLVASQMFQESRFDPKTRSRAGALGLMQVMPATGKELGLKSPATDLLEPATGIRAGVTYFKRMFNRFERVPRLEDRVYFTLASYNAGFGHVSDARILAQKLGLDPDRWENNVERAIILLEQPQYHKSAKYGFCRGSEPVGYVKEIQKRYVMYAEFIPSQAF